MVEHVACSLEVVGLNVFLVLTAYYIACTIRFITDCLPFTAGLVLKASVRDFRLLLHSR